ncbi:MAG: PHP domain-containing protein [Candidatus Tectomicrobia bacterium]|nr:PHP domain-containing protein [Candidatus Tectomicrobia bacterium]
MKEEDSAVDLHTHTIYSDGTSTPREVVLLAKKQGLRAIAITDHDSTGGIAEAIEVGQEEEIEVISGIELSVFYEPFEDIHILGYFIDSTHKELQEQLERFRQLRVTRGKKIVEEINRQLIKKGKVPLEWKGVVASAGVGSLGRPHIAQELLRKGHAETINEAFERFLIPYNIQKEKFPAEEGIALLKKVGGIAVFAHPHRVTDNLQDLGVLIRKLVELGLEGIEAYPGYHDRELTLYTALSQELNLVLTGGSDYHGARKDRELSPSSGALAIPYQVVKALKNRLSLLESTS